MSLRTTIAALGLAGLALTSACTGGTAVDADGVRSTSTPTPSADVSPLPTLAGPPSMTLFQVIKAFGVRPGSADDFLLRDLLTVADAQRKYLAVHGTVGALEDVRRAGGYRLGSSKVELVSGLGSRDRFCLRAFQSEDSPRQWFFDTDHVLPPGDSC